MSQVLKALDQQKSSAVRETFRILDRYVHKMKDRQRTTIDELIHIVTTLAQHKQSKVMLGELIKLYVRVNGTLVVRRGRYGGCFKGTAPGKTSEERSHERRSEYERLALEHGVMVYASCPFCGLMRRVKAGANLIRTLKCTRCENTFGVQTKKKVTSNAKDPQCAVKIKRPGRRMARKTAAKRSVGRHK